jgi:hypothetical protein
VARLDATAGTRRKDMSTTDPDDLEDVDQDIRINELKEQARELAGGEMTAFEAEGLPPHISEQFWRNVVESEQAGWTSNRLQLQQDGVDLPPTADLTDAALAAKLDDIFSRLAVRRTFFMHTDHLSDRQLYERLVSDVLNEEFPDMQAVCPDGVHIVDLVSSGSEEDTRLFNQYYADEADRQSWLEQFPGDAMPPHEPLPYDRDRRLPAPPEGW